MNFDSFRQLAQGIRIPEAGDLWEIPDEDAQMFRGCSSLPRMMRALDKLKTAALRQYENLSTARTVQDFMPPTFSERSWITSAKPVPVISMSLSYEAESGWYMSASQAVGKKREPATRVEMTGWVMAGWPDARQMITWELNTRAALHVLVPLHHID